MSEKNSVKISVVIPCFNHGEYLEEALESIHASTQKYPIEIIIVNDGSTDENTLRVLKDLEAKGYFVLHQTNQGLAKARNNGIAKSQGLYILPVDSDNRITFHYLNTAVDHLLKHPDVDAIYGDAEWFGDINELRKNHPIDRHRMLFANHIDACALFRRSTWTKVGGYSEDMPYMGCEDWDFWLKCMHHGLNCYYLPETCFHYRVSKNSMIRSTPKDYKDKIFTYFAQKYPAVYRRELNEQYLFRKNVTSGNLLKKLVKLTLHHFGLRNY